MAIGIAWPPLLQALHLLRELLYPHRKNRERRRTETRPNQAFFLCWAFVGQNKKTPFYQIKTRGGGGDEGIRTLETVSRLLP